MIDQFNAQSLAKLSKSALEAIIANYVAELNSSENEQVRADIQSKIVAARTALALK